PSASRSSFLHYTCSTRFTPLFFLTPPPPPRSSLFPYTTLFRSRIQRVDNLRPIHEGEERFRAVQRDGAEARAEAARDDHELHPRDRKSTRLNSSHVSISYAVFCLKKKKNKHNVDNDQTTNNTTY